MATHHASSSSGRKSLLLSLFALLSASNFAAAVDPTICPYDYTVLQRLGDTDYTDLPLRILAQNGNTVEFTVGNTWSAAGESIDQIFTSYAGDETGNKACDLSENVAAMESIDSKLTAYCTPTGVAMIRMYVRDSSFDADKDTATLPDCCVDPSNSNLPALEYMAILNCHPTCNSLRDGETEVEVRIGNEVNEAFELVYRTDTDSPSVFPSDLPSQSPTIADSDAPSVAPSKSNQPSLMPSVSPAPSNSPSDAPSGVPSASPSDEPTVSPAPSNPPSSAPSSQPTTIEKITCPPAGADPILVDVSFGTVLDIDVYSATDSVCALVEMGVSATNEPTDGLVPVGRSYSGFDWEASAGHFAAYDWKCTSGNSCTVYLPDPAMGRSYMLITYEHTHSYTQYDAIARFLEKTTFGPTRDEIFDGSFPGKEAWVQEQFDLPASSHRQYFRERMTNWQPQTSEFGLVRAEPCDVGARFRKYTFLKTDRDRWVSFEESPFDSNKVLLYMNGVLANVLEKPIQYEKDKVLHDLDISRSYYVYSNPVEGIGGRVRFYVTDVDGVNSARSMLFGGLYGNPAIWFDDDHLSLVEDLVVSLESGSYTEVMTQYFWYGNAEMLHLTSQLAEDQCNMTDDAILGFPDRLVLGRTLFNGTDEYWVHTTAYLTQQNDFEQPLVDGGKKAVDLTKDAPNEEKHLRAFCSSAPRTFLNEDTCILSDNACYPKEGSDKDIDLTEKNLEKIYTVTGGEGGAETRYVYIITGLRNEQPDGMPMSMCDMGMEMNGDTPLMPYPCMPGVRSRWMKRPMTETNCTGGTEWEDSTKAIFEDLLQTSTDPNPYLTDVFFPLVGTTCDDLDAEEFDFKIEIDGTCYENTHPDNYQVRDMTYWTTSAHKGNKPGSNKIKNFAELYDTWYLSFPSWHEMWRWHCNEDNFPYVGRYGDTTSIKSLPDTLLREDIAHAFGSAKAATFNDKVVVCGSPYEVANVYDENSGPMYSGGFGMRQRYNHTMRGQENQKYDVWLARALWAPDQLRQRMAFALSQILVVSPESGSTDFTESYTSYYDIFVRNAFGNYFDILKEVTYHPLMSYMLTYIDGISTGYSFVKLNLVQQADENYAREIMQLFTIGLYKLNIDGTTLIGDDGKEIRTYTNFDISEFAKVYTGLRRQNHRGNIDGHSNQVDPLDIRADYKDHLPKLGLDSRYIGDGYPLCSDVPDKHFLQKGATYLLLGADPNPSLLVDTGSWYKASPKRLSLDFDSPLAEYLCNSDGNQCNPQGKVVLDQDLTCSGIECDVNTPRSFEVAEGLWFEYVRPPCVNPTFYDNPMSIRRRWNDGFLHFSCANPANAEASTACCADGVTTYPAIRDELFGGERVAFNETAGRCDALGKNMCLDASIPNYDCENKTQGGCDNYQVWYWTKSPCTLQAKINQQGQLALVHRHEIPGWWQDVEDYYTYRRVDEKTVSYFRVDWQSDIDEFLDDYSGSCSASGCWSNVHDGTCQCNVTVYESKVFENSGELISAENVLSKATIGVFESTYSRLSFVATGVADVEVDSAAYSIDTIFKVVDSNGVIRYRKNFASNVELGDGGPTLRTPVGFFSLSEYTIRDARYEVDAALEHYFYHQNTAPFLAVRFAQRFGISNPSPRYIKEISLAFRSGTYNGFGSGKYGCLKATVAAIILDREAQTPSLDLDPTHGQLKEPFLKLIQLMRTLEYTPDSDRPIPSFDTNLQDRLGQEAGKMPSVFSFFTPQYSPTGPVQTAGLVSPESQVLNGPLVINLLNLFRSYVKYGLTRCYDGFGTCKRKQDGGCWDRCEIGDETTSHGNNRYSPSDHLNTSHAHDVVDELATLLTAGRLSPDNREIVKNAFDFTIENGEGEYEAMINAQQVIATAPEFHTTGLTRKVSTARTFGDADNATGIPYKSVIFFMLPGGIDSWHILAPESCTGVNSKNQTVLQQYLDQRGVMAFDRDAEEFDLKIDPKTDQPCESFAVHKSLPFVHQLYNDGDLLFMTNTGVINQDEMSIKNWASKTRTRLFDHGGMQEEAKKVDPYDSNVGTGVLGRAKDMLTKNGHNVNAMGIDQASILLNGLPGAARPTSTVSRYGVKEYGSRPGSEAYFPIESYTSMVNSATTPYTNVFAETFSNELLSGFGESTDLTDYLMSTELLDIWDGQTSSLSRKFQMLTKLMQTRDDRKSDRDFFYVDHGGWDHHSNMKYEMEWRLAEVNQNLEQLVLQLKADGLWENTTIVVASEFARTITPNNNAGSDHAWGGNYFMMGGAVKGGRVVGEFPDDFTADSPLNGSGNTRVRFIPTTSWDSIWHSVIQWLGIEDQDDIDYCLPNKDNTAPYPVEGRGEFPLFEKFDLFKDPNATTPVETVNATDARTLTMEDGNNVAMGGCLEGSIC